MSLNRPSYMFVSFRILSVTGWWCHSDILQQHIHSERAQTAVIGHGVILLCGAQSCKYGSVEVYCLITRMAVKNLDFSPHFSFSEFLRSGSVFCSQAVSAQSCGRDSPLSFSSYFTDLSILRVSREIFGRVAIFGNLGRSCRSTVLPNIRILPWKYWPAIRWTCIKRDKCFGLMMSTV